MSIRHKPKGFVDISQLVSDLENPTEQNLEVLNQKLGKYLDKIEEPLDLAFWETVKFTYWSHVNLLKLTDKSYNASSEDFVKRVYETANRNIRNSPKPQPSELPSNAPPQSSNWSSYFQPKYIAGGVIALLIVSVTVKLVKDE